MGNAPTRVAATERRGKIIFIIVTVFIIALNTVTYKVNPEFFGGGNDAIRKMAVWQHFVLWPTLIIDAPVVLFLFGQAFKTMDVILTFLNALAETYKETGSLHNWRNEYDRQMALN